MSSALWFPFDPRPRRFTTTSLGSGVIVAADGTILTNEHVILRASRIHVTLADEREFDAKLVGADSDSDVAVLRVPGLSARPLRLADPKYGTAVAIVGYPQNGPFDVVPGRVGSTVTVLTQDAYGRGLVARTVTSLSGDVRHGDSGGAAVDASGAVQSTVFAARVSGTGGYGIPAAVVRRDLKNTRVSVTTGPCT